MIEVVASQITDKLETFKKSFTTELSNKIESAIRDNLSKELSFKNGVGVSS